MQCSGLLPLTFESPEQGLWGKSWQNGSWRKPYYSQHNWVREKSQFKNLDVRLFVSYLLGGNETLPPPWVSQHLGQLGVVWTHHRAEVFPKRSQQPGQKNSLSQWPCVPDQGQAILLSRNSAVVNINNLDGLCEAEFCPCYFVDNRPIEEVTWNL